MPTFIHKKHINKIPKSNKVVVYYSVPDIVLGLLLLILVTFFVYNYAIVHPL